MERNTRPRGKPIYVWTTPQERQEIESRAQEAGLSLSAYLRVLGLHHQPKPLFDQDAVLALVKVAADQGQLGGLLKRWLSSKRGEGAPVKDVRALLTEIEQLQGQLREIVRRA